MEVLHITVYITDAYQKYTQTSSGKSLERRKNDTKHITNPYKT